MVGYRGMKASGIAFPFGHGLSYSSYQLSKPEIKQVKCDAKSKSIEVEVKVDLKNSGDRSGAQVVQCYVSPPKLAGKLVRAEKELGDFRKVHLEKGANASVTLKLDRGAFSYWHPTRASAWVVDAGTYKLQIGTSSVDIDHVVDVEIPESFTWKGL